MNVDDLTEIEEATGSDLPGPYRELLLALPARLDREASKRVWRNLGHLFVSPEDVIQANNGVFDPDCLAGTEWEDEDIESLFVVGSDGCGNYFVVDPDDEDPEVRLLSHDPLGIEDVSPTLTEWCESVLSIVQTKPRPWYSLLAWCK